MKKKTKKHQPFSKNKLSRFNQQKKNEPKDCYLGPKFVNSIVIGLNEDDDIHVKKIIEGLDEYDLARLIEVLDVHHRMKLVKLLGDKIDPAVFPELNEVVQEQVLETLNENQIVKIVNELDSDDAVEILENMNDEEQEHIISRLNPELKYQVKSSLNYPEDSAGRIMSRDFVSIPDNWTVREARQYLLNNEELPDDFYTIFLVDEKTLKPTGEIALDKLLRAKGDEKLNSIMDGEIVPVDVYTDQEEVAHMFREYGWMSAMVVDNKGRLIGVINIDDVVEIVHEETNEDMMLLTGAESNDVYRSVFSIFKSRSIWLVTNLFATIVAASVVGEFQDIIAQLSILAVLMPIVASMGGTTGRPFPGHQRTELPQRPAHDRQRVYGRPLQRTAVCGNDRNSGAHLVPRAGNDQLHHCSGHALQSDRRQSGRHSHTADHQPAENRPRDCFRRVFDCLYRFRRLLHFPRSGKAALVLITYVQFKFSAFFSPKYCYNAFRFYMFCRRRI